MLIFIGPLDKKSGLPIRDLSCSGGENELALVVLALSETELLRRIQYIIMVSKMQC